MSMPPPPFVPWSDSPASPVPGTSHPPGADAPPTCEVPPFAPVRVRGGRYQLQRLLRSRRRALALGLAVTAAALVAAGPGDGADRPPGHPGDGPRAHARPVSGERDRRHRAAETVSAPVRIADAGAVRLLRPGDRVDVIAAGQTASGADARVVARDALVTNVPEPTEDAGVSVDGGALVVLSVPRTIAARLAGAGATARLAVTLC
ncbi:hypothetical protein [Streptomyces sp. bgisy153]|uniref:hypothetical protein n=1 Tax=Streptomyces sp. bgisy153 TaxID=3413793 RepID=UPI003D710E38